MADVDHPKTHVENQESAELPRTQPESPKNEGIDPLTESDTMYPAEDTKDDSEKLSQKIADGNITRKKRAADAPVPADETAAEYSDRAAAMTSAQEEREAGLKEHGYEAGDGTGRLTDTAEPLNADGKLPKDAQIVNGVGSDKGNTSESNKVATANAPKKGTTKAQS